MIGQRRFLTFGVVLSTVAATAALTGIQVLIGFVLGIMAVLIAAVLVVSADLNRGGEQ